MKKTNLGKRFDMGMRWRKSLSEEGTPEQRCDGNEQIALLITGTRECQVEEACTKTVKYV